MNAYLQELQREGLVIVDTLQLAEQIREAAARELIGKPGVFGLTIRRIQSGGAVPGRFAGRSGYYVMTL